MTPRERGAALLLVVLSVLAVAALLRRRPGRSGVLLATVLGIGELAWLFASPSYEGPTVLKLSEGRGLTAVDLGVLPGLTLAAAVIGKELLIGRRDRRRVVRLTDDPVG